MEVSNNKVRALPNLAVALTIGAPEWMGSKTHLPGGVDIFPLLFVRAHVDPNSRIGAQFSITSNEQLRLRAAMCRARTPGGAGADIAQTKATRHYLHTDEGCTALRSHRRFLGGKYVVMFHP